VRGPTETNSLEKWALSRRRNIEQDYRTLIEAGLISDNCTMIHDAAEADCGPAIEHLEMLIENNC
jgi:hypothetical protein